MVFSYFTGFEQDDGARLVGDEIIQVQKIFSTCADCCPQIEAHAPYFVPYYKAVGGAVGIPIPAPKSIPSAQWFWAVQSRLQTLYNIAVGVPFKDWIYNTSGMNNFMQSLGVFTVHDCDVDFITVRAEGIDPRSCTPTTYHENPNYPLSGNRYESSNDGGGTLQPFDYLLFGGGGALGRRGVRSFALSYEYLGDGYFKIFTPINTSLAKPSLLSEPDGVVEIFRRLCSQPRWDDIPASKPFYATQVSNTYSTASIVSLDFLMYPDKFNATIDNTAVSDKIRKRLFVDSDNKTHIYLGGLNWDGSEQENLKKHGSNFKLTCYKYDPSSGFIIGQRVCKHLRHCNLMKNWGDGIVDSTDMVGLSVYCAKRGEASSVKRGEFEEWCFKTHCSEFELPSETLGKGGIISFLDNVWMAQDVYLLQDTAGYGYFSLEASKHVSIFQLLGHYKPETPTLGSEPKRINMHNGIFGHKIDVGEGGAASYQNISGGILRNSYDYGDLEITDGKQAVQAELEEPENLGGMFACGSPEDAEYHKSKKSQYNWDTDETDYHRRTLPYFKKGGYRQNSIATGGAVDETEQCRGGEIKNAIVYGSIGADRKPLQNHQVRVESGSWDKDLVPNEAGEYGLKVSILNSGLPTGNHPVIVEGVVHRAERVDADTVRIHCELSATAVGKSDGDETIVRTYMRGGNIVELPDWMKDNNRFAFNMFHSDQKAQKGHAFYCVLKGVGRKFTIKNCYPCTGDKLSYIPQDMNAVTPFRVPSISLGLKIPYAIASTNVGEQEQYKKMYFACIAMCPVCEKERKFKLLWNKSQDYPYMDCVFTYWECQKCGEEIGSPTFYPDNPNIGILGVPPMMHSIHFGLSSGAALGYELAADEWSLKPVMDESGEIHHWEIFFSPFIVDYCGDKKLWMQSNIFNPSNGKYDIHEAIDFIYLDHWLDMPISEEHYNALLVRPEECYFKLYDGRGALVELERTGSNDLRDWWGGTAGHDKRYSYCLQAYPKDGVDMYFIRFHNDFGGAFGEYYWSKKPPEGITSDEYYDMALAGMNGIYSTHKEWACKADILDIVDGGELTNLSDLEHRSFTVANNAVIHDSSLPSVEITEREIDEFEVVGDPLNFRADGIILIKKADIAGHAGKPICVRVSNLTLNNNTGCLTARHFNETETVLRNIRTCEATISGEPFNYGGSYYNSIVAKNVSFNSDCCPQNTALYYSNHVVGLNRQSINDFDPDNNEGLELIGVEQPVPITVVGQCGGVDLDDRYTGIEGASILSTGASFGFYSGVMFDVGGAEPQLPSGKAVISGIGFTARPFNLNQVDSLPVGATINKAVIRLTATNIKYNEEWFDYGENEEGTDVELKEHGQTQKEAGGVSIIIFGRTLEGAINVIAMKGIPEFVNGEYYDITECVQAMQTAIQGETEYIGFNIALAPYKEDLVLSGGGLLEAIRDASHEISHTEFIHPSDSCKDFWYCDHQKVSNIQLDGFLVNEVFIDFTLPDGDFGKVPNGSMPSFAPFD